MTAILSSVLAKVGAKWRAYQPPLTREGTLILALLTSIQREVHFIMATLADIQTAETDEATAITGVLGEIAKLQTDLAAAQASGADPAAMQAIVDQIHANTDKLKATLPPASNPTPPAAA